MLVGQLAELLVGHELQTKLVDLGVAETTTAAGAFEFGFRRQRGEVVLKLASWGLWVLVERDGAVSTGGSRAAE